MGKETLHTSQNIDSEEITEQLLTEEIQARLLAADELVKIGVYNSLNEAKTAVGLVTHEIPDVTELEVLRKGFRKHRKAIAIGAATLIAFTGASKLTWNYFNQSGKHILYQPANPEHIDINNQLTVDTWNQHNEAAARSNQLKKILRSSSVVALQEVSGDDAKILSEKLKHVYITFAIGDDKQQTLNGGYGNALITKQKPTNIDTQSISGTSFLKSILGALDGFTVDVANANTSLHQTKEGIQESRVALAETIKIKVGDELKDLRVITSHLSGANEVSYIFGEDPIEADQREKFGEYIKSELRDDRPTLVMGDFNASPDVIVPWFEGMNFIVLKTPHTSSSSRRTIDYIAINLNGVDQPMSVEEANRLKRFHTDHYAVEAKFTFGPAENANVHYPLTLNQERLAQNDFELRSQTPVVEPHSNTLDEHRH